MKRRKIRKYRSHRKNSGVKFIGFIGIMIVAIICGYLTARFVIGPMLGYDTEVLKLDFTSKLTSLLDKSDDGEDKTDEKSEEEQEENKDSGNDKTTESGYALQFGLFSTKVRAEELVSKLEAAGIESQIRTVDGKYKVISPVVSTKEAALENLKDLDTSKVSDVFVTTID